MNEIKEIGYINIWCADLTGTKAFFKDQLNMPIAFENQDVVVFGMQGTQFILRRAYDENEYRAGSVQIGFYVDGMEQLIRDLRQSSGFMAVERINKDAEQPSTTVRTPGGHYVEFIERLTKEEKRE